MSDIILNKGQMNAFKKGNEWWHSDKKFTDPFVIQGRPGTGKSTMIHLLIKHLKLKPSQVVFGTYVGRATLPLVKSGLDARTIHNICYERVEEFVYDNSGKRMKDEFGNYLKKSYFKKKECLPDNIKLIVIDEGGMVPENMCNDIESFGLPIIVAGDIDQLPPVFGRSKWMLNPTVILDEIMRQKQGDPIIHIAELARVGKDIHTGKYGPRCYVVDEDILKDKRIYTRPDIIICGRNKTRDNINNIVRHEILGYKGEFPVIGDKLVCRKNNWDETINDGQIALINGLFGYVMNIYPESYNGSSFNIDFNSECSDEWFENIPVDLSYIGIKDSEDRSKYNTRFAKGEIFEFGYASTCHMAQGSQYGYCLVIDDGIGSGAYHNKFLYTAITRAKNTLVLVKKKKKKQFFVEGW